MPELPEVETIVRRLRPSLVGRTIAQAEVLWTRSLVGLSAEQFGSQISGQGIVGVSRRAKYLVFQLTDLYLLIHLRMSGDLTMRAGGYEPDVHDRLILRLGGPKQEPGLFHPNQEPGLFHGPGHGSAVSLLVFNDTRKFGRVWLTAHPEDVVGKLGPEPLEDSFTPQVLYSRLIKKHRQLKPLLLDQSFLAGLGNIYSDEAIHLSGVHPLRISDTISVDEAQRLHAAIQSVLLAGIEHNGASFDWVYRGGGFQNYFRVYGREGQPCPVCGALIQKIVVGQRGTHFCPVCQPIGLREI